jgi:hypothetical protein
MLLDYFLTVLSEERRREGYSRHFRTEHLELNPVWQEDIKQRKWFNPRQILVTVLATALLLWVDESGLVPDYLVHFALGALLASFGTMVGRHLGNLLTFGRIKRKPDEISGTVTLSHNLLIRFSVYQLMPALIPITIIVGYNPSPFTVGAAFGMLCLFIAHGLWLRSDSKKPSKTP